MMGDVRAASTTWAFEPWCGGRTAATYLAMDKMSRAERREAYASSSVTLGPHAINRHPVSSAAVILPPGVPAPRAGYCWR